MRGDWSQPRRTALVCYCQGVEVQYSVDLGETWSLVQSECMMGNNVACNSYSSASVLSSDVFYDWTRVAINLPYYTRSRLLWYFHRICSLYIHCVQEKSR